MDQFAITQDTHLYAMWKNTQTGGNPSRPSRPNPTDSQSPADKDDSTNTNDFLLTIKSATGNVINGVAIELTGSNYAQILTTQNGKVLFPNLEKGLYTVRIIKVPQGYTFDTSQIHEFFIEDGQMNEYEMIFQLSNYTPNTNDDFNGNFILIALFFMILLCAYFRKKEIDLMKNEQEN